MQVVEEDPGEPAWWNVDKKLQDAVVWPLVVTKPLSTSLTSPPPPSPPSPPSQNCDSECAFEHYAKVGASADICLSAIAITKSLRAYTFSDKKHLASPGSCCNFSQIKKREKQTLWKQHGKPKRDSCGHIMSCHHHCPLGPHRNAKIIAPIKSTEKP